VRYGRASTALASTGRHVPAPRSRSKLRPITALISILIPIFGSSLDLELGCGRVHLLGHG
jgi:hypothetical protein